MSSRSRNVALASCFFLTFADGSVVGYSHTITGRAEEEEHDGSKYFALRSQSLEDESQNREITHHDNDIVRPFGSGPGSREYRYTKNLLIYVVQYY